mgnify:CR=1 FL=1
MVINNEQATPVVSEDVKQPTLSPESYDADTPTIVDAEGRKSPLRIANVGGTEIGAGSDAEYFRNGLYGIFGDAEVKAETQGKGVFGRDVGNLEVEGLDWRHMLYEVGVSDNWTNYGYDAKDSEADERYKWYAGITQSSNLEAYELLESGIKPNEIISDEDFSRIELLRNSLKTHMADAQEGVPDKEQAKLVAQQLMANPELNTLAQKRRWYESAQNTNVAKVMLANWNDPFTRSDIESQGRVTGMDVTPRVDTSYWAMTKNAVKQWKDTTSPMTNLQHIVGWSEQDLDKYIQDNDVSPDVAAKMFDAYETDGGEAAVDIGEYAKIDKETIAIGQSLSNQKGAASVAKEFYMGAAPYLTDPTTYIGGALGAKTAVTFSKFAFQKVASPLTSKLLTNTTIGAGTGLGESFVFTHNNYKDFTNDELLKTWALDAGFGAAFGFVFTGAAHAIGKYGEGAKAKAAGEGLDDIEFNPTDTSIRDKIKSNKLVEKDASDASQRDALAKRDAEWDAELEEKLVSEGKSKTEITQILNKVATARSQTRREKGLADVEYKNSVDAVKTRVDEMQDDIASELQKGEVPQTTMDIQVEARPTNPKPQPKVAPLIQGKERASAPEGKPKADEPKTDEPAVDTRSPEEIQADEDLWQTAEVDLALQHQIDVVQPAMEKANKSHNWISKVHRALGKGLGLQEFASKLMFSKDRKMAYIGSQVLESGAGFSGKFKRKASAALEKDAIYTRNVGNLNKSYVDNIKGWSAAQGHSTYKQFKAAWEGGKVNDVAKAFHRAVFQRQEARQMGHTLEPDKFLDDYITALNKVNDELFEGRIAANVKGFDAARRIKNYMPHIWKKVKVAEIVKRHGEQSVLELLTKSIESAKRAGKLADDVPTSELAERQLNWINGLGDSMEHADSVGAGVSGRGKSRIPLDFTTEHNGLSMVDLVDTDIPSVMDSYIQRAGADIGISNATGGLIRSEGDFVKFLTPDSDADKLLAQDAQDLLYGRPTRMGMSPEMRSIMDMTSIQQMGGIGVAQLAETGTMAQRLLVNYFSQPKIGKKIWAMAGESMDDKGVMAQVRSISAVNDNMQYINRYSVNNIDQAQIDELSSMRAASIDAVDKLTLGAYKAQFGRMLGSLSGVNAVQKAQSRLLQASFSVDIARGFKFNKGTSTTKRLTDLGLTDDGMVANSMRTHVEFDADGFPTNFNFDKWDKPALDEFVLAMNREEAQLMPRVMAGELPVFMNKPIWQAIMQFRKTPLAFMSKGAQRNLQFADREAVLGTVLNAMTAGVTRYAKVAAGAGAYAALSDTEFQQPTANQMQTENYVSNLGILGDAYNLGKDWTKAYQEKDGIESLWEGAKSVPVLSNMDNAYHALEGDPASIKRAMPLNTLPLMNEVTNAVIKHMEQN